jgi:hypothetical protein
MEKEGNKEADIRCWGRTKVRRRACAIHRSGLVIPTVTESVVIEIALHVLSNSGLTL